MFKNDQGNSVDKIKEVVKYYKSSSLAFVKLCTIKKQMNLPWLKFKQDVSTKWNSTSDMIKKFTKLKAQLCLHRLDYLKITWWQRGWHMIETSAVFLISFINVDNITIQINTEKSVHIKNNIVCGSYEESYWQIFLGTIVHIPFFQRWMTKFLWDTKISKTTNSLLRRLF